VRGDDLRELPALRLVVEQGLRHALRRLEASRVDHQGPVEALLLLVVGCGCEVRRPPRGAVRAEPVGGDVSDVELPQSEDHRVEDDGHDRGDGRREHAGGNADGEGEEDVDRVLRVLERVAEPYRRHDGGERERERQAVLHQDDRASDGHRQDDDRLDDRLIVARAPLGDHVDPRDGEHEQERGEHRQQRDQRPRALRQRLRAGPDDLLQVAAAARGGDAQHGDFAKVVEQSRQGGEQRDQQPDGGAEDRVYLAVEQHPRRRVAIKVLDPEISTRLLRERFIREVDLSSKLSHPHIVPIFAAGEAAGLFYYVMPYVEGESLRHRLLRERKLALADALHITRDVADALGFAHAQGIIHRDIKPENILLTGDHAIVADFGIARAISAAGTLTLTQTGQSMGSPGYMSPEQAIGSGQLDARTDVYSLGCVLFEMLAGEPRVMSLTERLIHNWSALESSPALRRADANVARAVKHAVSKALAPLPDDRFPTAGA